MKRAASYSDSYLILNSDSAERSHPVLTPILIPVSRDEPAAPAVPSRSRGVLCFLFTFKGGLHLLLISAFETLFYFLYVNQSENNGIRKTIDTYYKPLVANCSAGWSNETRVIVGDVLARLVNVSNIDAAGNAAAASRFVYNRGLLYWSASYSGIFLVLCLAAAGYVKWARWVVPWRRMFSENLMFIGLLALYEIFFFRTIIYNYETISTAELSQYIVDGLETCAAGD